MPDFASQPTTIDEQIASVREKIRELVERAAAYSSAADDDLATRRIADQEDRFELLTKRPDELSRRALQQKHTTSEMKRSASRDAPESSDALLSHRAGIPHQRISAVQCHQHGPWTVQYEGKSHVEPKVSLALRRTCLRPRL